MRKVVTINYMNVELVVIGYYDPAINAIQYDSDMSGYPGDPAIFSTDEVYVSDSNIDIIDFLIEEQLRDIEDLVLIKLEE